MRTRSILAVALLFFLLSTGSTQASGTWTTLDYPGASGTSVFGIDGSSIVGFYYYSPADKHAFLYDGTSWTALDYPGAYLTQANGISGGSIVGYYDQGPAITEQHGFVYDGTWTSLSYPGAPTTGMGAGTWAGGIDGSNVVGAYGDSSGNGHAFLYDGATWTTLDAPWAESGPTGKSVTQAYGIDGSSIVGSYTDSLHNSHGFLFDGTDWTSLSYPGAVQTWALDVSGNVVVGTWADGSGGAHGFLYDGTWTALDFPGAVKTHAYGIDGSTIVGSYVDGAIERGFIYSNPTVVPLPSAALLAMIGLSVAGMRSRRE